MVLISASGVYSLGLKVNKNNLLDGAPDFRVLCENSVFSVSLW